MADDTPYEITLTMNAVSQIIDAVSPPYDDVSVMAPSSQLENVLGYDAHIRHPYLKFTGLQFKRPYSMADPDLLNFKLNTEQLSTLHEVNSILPGQKAMFYALPPVKNYTNLSQTLSRTVFVDIEGVRSNSTRIRVPIDHCQSHPTKSSLNAWEKDAGLYEISADHIYCWWEFVQGIVYPLLDLPIEYIQEWNFSRREPLVDPESPSNWRKFTEDIPHLFEDPDYERQIGVPLRAPTAVNQDGFDPETVYDSTEQIAYRIERSEISGDDLSSMAGAVAGGNPMHYR